MAKELPEGKKKAARKLEVHKFYVHYYYIRLNYSFQDDKKLGGVLKKLALTNLNGVEEVNIFKADGNVIHITTPKSKLYYAVIEFSLTYNSF